MTNSSTTSNFLNGDGRHPLTAAALSLVPGLGQLYVGEKRKGLLFLDVTAANAVLLWAMLFTDPMIKAVQSMGTTFHFRPNEMMMDVMREAHIGSPASILVLGMMASFAFYAARDAYDRAFGSRRRKIYPEFVVDLSEATSGSYIVHIAMIFAFALMALFFVMPKPKTEIVSISFVDLEQFQKPLVKPKTDNAAQHDNEAHGRKTEAKPRVSKQVPSMQHQTQSNVVHPVQRSAASHTNSGTPSKQSSDKGQRSTAAREVTPQPVRQTAKTTQPQPLRQSTQSQAKLPSPMHTITRSESAPSNPLPQPLRPQPLRTLPNPSANAAPMPASLSATHANVSPTAAPKLMPTNNLLVLANIAPTLPVHGASPASSAAPSFTPHGVSHSGEGNLPVPPAAAGTGAHSAISAGVPGPRGLSSGGHNAFQAPLPAGGGNSHGTEDGMPGIPAPVAVNGGGTAGNIGDGMPGLAPVRGLGTNGHGTAGPGGNAPRPTRVGPGYGNDIISILPTPNVGGGPRAKGEPSGTDRTVDDKKFSPGAKTVDFGEYMAMLQRRIKKHWFPPSGRASNRVIVTFTVALNGELSDLKIEHSAGRAIEDNAALKAVEDSAPLPHLPEGAPASVQIEFTFDYNVMSGGGGSWHRI